MMNGEDYQDFYDRMKPEVQMVLGQLTLFQPDSIDGIGYYRNTITIEYRNGSKLTYEM